MATITMSNGDQVTTKESRSEVKAMMKSEKFIEVYDEDEETKAVINSDLIVFVYD